MENVVATWVWKMTKTKMTSMQETTNQPASSMKGNAIFDCIPFMQSLKDLMDIVWCEDEPNIIVMNIIIDWPRWCNGKDGDCYCCHKKACGWQAVGALEWESTSDNWHGPWHWQRAVEKVKNALVKKDDHQTSSWWWNCIGKTWPKPIPIAVVSVRTICAWPRH